MDKLHGRRDGVSTSSSNSQRQNERHGDAKGRERSRLACDQCRKRKLKCDNVRPCRSCRTKLLTCTVSSSSRPPGRPRNIDVAPMSPGKLYTGHYQSANPAGGEGDAVHDGVDNVSAVDPQVGQWTPNGTGTPSSLVTPGPNSSETTNFTPSASTGDTFFEAAASATYSLGQWLHVSEAASIPSVQAPLDAATAYLQQTWETNNFWDDVIPSSVSLPLLCHNLTIRLELTCA
jgi:hypothetical protein